MSAALRYASVAVDTSPAAMAGEALASVAVYLHSTLQAATDHADMLRTTLPTHDVSAVRCIPMRPGLNGPQDRRIGPVRRSRLQRDLDAAYAAVG